MTLTKHSVRARNIKLGDVIEVDEVLYRVYAFGTFPNSWMRFHLETLDDFPRSHNLFVSAEEKFTVYMPEA